MVKCFDWDRGLALKDKSGLEYDLYLKGFKTVIGGLSGTGKTLLCQKLKEIKRNRNPEPLRRYDASNIIVIDDDNVDYMSGNLKDLKGHLIVIDRADMIMNNTLKDWINYDCGFNKYLIFGRSPLGIYVSPNYFGEFVEKDKKITIEYLFDVRGWN